MMALARFDDGIENREARDQGLESESERIDQALEEEAEQDRSDQRRQKEEELRLRT